MKQMQTLTWADGPMTLEGAVSVEPMDEGWVRPWRVFYDRLRLYESALLTRACFAAGIRLTLISDTSQLAVQVHTLPDQSQTPDCTFDLLVDGQRHERQRLSANDLEQPRTLTFANLPAGSHHLELYLPQSTTVCLGPVQIDADATADTWRDTRPRWVVYGSSITQCSAADGPSETWPAIVANRLGLHLTCLGFGGQCHFDPMVGRTIGQLPADRISLCLGINTHGGTYNERTFRAAVIGLIQLIRDRHPDVPMVCVSPICSPPREDSPGGTGMTLQLMRTWIADAVDALRAHGDDRLAYADGLSLFGPEFVHHMPDELHPDAEGCRVLAEQYLEQVMPRFNAAAATSTD
ncbi:GDSL-type esterase/lipase family protein [Phycisphaerales bacterium AB-hyl4]|uniref:GDSL-type esterase/lipase family protein n=1 Tax=Natronomicrosphaera hydrolytica TaxID=3242702 RepID=A0ABV4U3X9_9BACT